MPFEFSDPSYSFPAKWNEGQKMAAYSIIREGIRNDLALNAISRELKRAGVSYRRTNMLRDLSFAYATEQAKTPQKHYRAILWFETAEHVREERGLRTRKEAFAFMKAWQERSLENTEDKGRSRLPTRH